VTDADFLLDVLKDGQWHSLQEILWFSFKERGCGLTTHSRAADLRARGYDVQWKGGKARESWYRLVTPEQQLSLLEVA
jgi:hypothetical protein